MPNIDTTQSVINPLSPLDHDKVALWGITVGYVIQSVDSIALESAARRMVNKWRLLAGRLEWSKKSSSWFIRIPLEGDVSHRIKFTTRLLHIPLDTPIIPVGKGSVEILVRPSRIDFFRHPSTPVSLNAFSSSNAPLVSIHVTKLANCTCVGISFPHGVFDAYGVGLVIQSLNAELHGKPWEAPAFHEINIMRETLHDLGVAPPLYTEEPASVVNFRHQFVRATLRNMIRFAASFAHQNLWVRHEVKAVYLGEYVVRELVRKAQEEVKAKGSGAGWVSTADVLTAWFLKAVFSRETGNDLVSIVEMVSTRGALAEKDPAFATYLHNALMICSIPPVSKKRLGSMSIADIALMHRQFIASVRNVASVQAYRHVTNELGMNSVPASQTDTESCTISNQTGGRVGAIDFGFEMHALWIWVTPWLPEYSVFIYLNQFKGGYIIEARLRSDRWDAVAEEVGKLDLDRSSAVRARL